MKLVSPRFTISGAAFIPFLVFCPVLAWQMPELGSEGKLGKEMVLNKSYKNAIRHLEAGLEETPNHPLLLEYLGIAYLECVSSLDGPACAASAEKNMDAAISHGGQATFIVDLSLAKTNVFIKGQDELKVKRGLLHIDDKQVAFEPDGGGEAVQIPKSEIKSTGRESKQVSTHNLFYIATKTNRYRFRAADFSPDQAKLALKLVENHLGVSSKN